PNNMALILTGNFDAALVKPVIKEKFGDWEAKPLPSEPTYPINSFDGKESRKGRYTPVKVMMMAQKTVPNGHPDEAALEVCSNLLYNYEETGLLNKLQLDGKLLYALSEPMKYNKDGANMLVAVPKILGQSFGKTEKLVLTEIEKLKVGAFSDQLFSSTKHFLAQNFDEQLEDVTSRGILMGYTFNQGKTWEEYANYRERIENVTKEQVMEVAQKYFGDDYFVLYSRMGFPKKTKLDKPGFKPVVTKQDKSSLYAKRFEQIETLTQTPRFINFEKDVEQVPLNGGNQLFVTKNPINQIFSLTIQYWVGKKALGDLPIITSMLNYSGTADKELKVLKEVFAQLGISYYFSSNANFFTINLSGEEKNLGAALAIIDELMTKPNFDDNAIKLTINDIKTNYKLEFKSPQTIGSAMREYAMFGNRSSFLDRPNKKAIKSKSSKILKLGLVEIKSYKASLHYTGNQSTVQVEQIVMNNFQLEDTDKKADWDYPESELPQQNTIYVINDKKAVQSQIWYVIEGQKYTLDQAPRQEAFSQYFGGGFSGLALQEIREYRSLAYSAGAFYRTSRWQQNKQGNFIAYIGCQADKTLDAIGVMNELVMDMPRYEDRLPNLVESLKNKTFTKYPSFREVSKRLERYQALGVKEDLSKTTYESYDQLSFDDIQAFYEDNIKGKPITITIYGDTSKIDMEALAKIGKIVELKKSDVLRK
ncbi:MAG: insulinase family protein, partial [Bacteroidota bacterium]